jgi:serine/threonine kinase 38
MQLERNMQGMGVPEEKRKEMRKHLEHEEILAQKQSRKTMSPTDFESLTVVGRGAFGEVRLVRDKRKNSEPVGIYALKSMKKEMMVLKNQVGHVRAEREALAKASSENRWLTALHYSFVDETHLYMVMEFCPGGDLMSLLIKEDTFSEHVTRFFMAEAAHAISSVHALGYIHRDIKPDNMLLDSRGHLKLTDMGLCKKVGEVSPMDDPNIVLKTLKEQGYIGREYGMVNNAGMGSAGRAAGRHRNSDDAMAMSIDDNIDGNFATGQRQNPNLSAKTRREVCFLSFRIVSYHFLVNRIH